MAEKEKHQFQSAFLQSDLNTRIQDLEEKNNIMKERTLLLGKNLISIKEETENEITSLKDDIRQIKKQVENSQKLIQNLLSETDKFVRKDEVRIIERMLKDFQPLEFIREKEINGIIENILKNPKSQNYKNLKSIKNKEGKNARSS